ncbi:4'-phosphopantetheinyl transferase superfamily protein [Arthrobacter sp. RAF14]|uniref:4'-phosphopantetheinyl transferase superfamily protein n=1 Tax=Arthrobacter sp. RAF14 TaxID=3233051 RepID=UPI003F905B70
MRVITWLGSLDEASRLDGLPPLDAAEQERARAFTSDVARERFGTLRRIQRGLLAEALGTEPGRLLSSYDCPDCGFGAGHGRPGYLLAGPVTEPQRASAAGSAALSGTGASEAGEPLRLSGVALSASRAGEWGAVVVVAGVERGFWIGLDLTLHEEIFDGFDDVALSGPEKSWLDGQPPARRNAGRAALWAAKEAAAKRDGHGLRKDPARIAVLAAAEDRGSEAGYAPGVVRLETRAEGLPPHALMAAVPAAAEDAFRRATA